MGDADLAVARRVVKDVIRLAALEVPGVMRVGRGGGLLRATSGRAVSVRIRDGAVETRIWLVAQPGQALVPLTRNVRAAVAASIRRLLDLEVGYVTVIVDGVGP
jgi:uncharacterized alkaline shock family protein YloU